MTKESEIVSPRVAALLNKRLAELDMTKSDLIRKFQLKYNAGARNSLFKILNGKAAIGEKDFLPKIAKLLEIDVDHLTQLVRTDKIETKGWATALPKADKITQDVATVMEGLTKKQREGVLKYVIMIAED